MMNEKIKEQINRVLSVFNRFTFFVDLVVFSLLISHLGKIEDKSEVETVFYYGLIVTLIVYAILYIRGIVIVIKSRIEREVYLLSNRVCAITGKQRVGKTSLGVYFSKYAKKVYSNTPMRVKRKFTNKLTTDILTLKTRIEDESMLIIDEANLFYNNTMSHEDKLLFGQALLCQCVGHFFDGNILYIATDVDRMPKIIRDEWSTKLQVLRSRSYHYSIFGDLLLKSIYAFVNGEPLKFTGIRIWEAQQYEKIYEEQYISLLGQKEDENHFAPFYEFCAYQDIGSVEYDDRYMNAYYLERDLNVDETWKQLQLDREDFEKLYDGLLSKYIKNLEAEKTEKKENPKDRIKTE